MGEGMSSIRIACVVQLEIDVVEQVLNARNRQFPIHWDQSFYMLSESVFAGQLEISLAKDQACQAKASCSINIQEHIESMLDRASRKLVRLGAAAGPDGSCLLLDIEMQLRTVLDTPASYGEI